MPHDLINAKPVSAVIKDFWVVSVVAVHGSNQSTLRGDAQASAFGSRTRGLTRERAGLMFVTCIRLTTGESARSKPLRDQTLV